MDMRLLWLALGSFTIGTEGFVVVSLLPSIASDTGTTVPQAGTLIMAFSLAYAFGSPILATIAGATDRRHLVSASMVVFAVANLLAAMSTSFDTLLGARVLMALGAGLFAATAQATAIAMSHHTKRGRAISIIVGGTTVAVAFGAPIGALIAQFVGWRGTFLAISILAFVTAAALWTMLPRGLEGTRLPMRDRLTVAIRPGIWPALLTTSLTLTGAFTVFAYVAPLATREAGLSEAALPGLLLCSGIGAAVGNFTGGHLADRIGATLTVCLSLALSGLVLLSLSGLPTALPHALVGPAVLVAMFLWGAVGWMFPPAQTSRIVHHAPELAQISLSLNVSALYVGVALGSIVGGEVLRLGSALDLGWVAAIFPLVGLMVVLGIRPATVRVATSPAE